VEVRRRSSVVAGAFASGCARPLRGVQYGEAALTIGASGPAPWHNRRPFPMPLDPEFLRILRCPKTRKPLRMATEAELSEVNRLIAGQQLVDVSGRKREQPVAEGLVPEGEALLYPIEDGIPILLIDDALPLEAAASR